MCQAKCLHSWQQKVKCTQTLLGSKTGCGFCDVRKGNLGFFLYAVSFKGQLNITAVATFTTQNVATIVKFKTQIVVTLEKGLSLKKNDPAKWK